MSINESPILGKSLPSLETQAYQLLLHWDGTLYMMRSRHWLIRRRIRSYLLVRLKAFELINLTD